MRSLSKAATPWSCPSIEASGTNLEHRIPRQEAEEVIRRAHQEGQKIRQMVLQQAREEAEFIREKAREDGFMEGFEEGQKTAAEERERFVEQLRSSLLERLEHLTIERTQYWEKLLEGLASRVGEMALICCRKLVGRVPEGSLPEETVRRALESIGDGNTVQVRVHPDDQTVWPKHIPLELVLDDSIAPGEYFLRGNGGTVDGSWEKRWAKVEAILLEDEV